MSFALLHSRLPELAEQETRSAFLPDGTHLAFYEMFCTERGCDCRRVMVQVVDVGRSRLVATLTWGWESEDFYRAWYGGPVDEAFMEDLLGPCFQPMTPRTERSDLALELFELNLQDQAYADRIVRHYGLFRASVEGRSSARRTGSGDKRPSRRERRKRREQRQREREAGEG